MKTKTYNCFEYNDFDKFVKEKLGINYESISANEWNNYSAYTSDNIKKSDYLDEYYQKYDLPKIDTSLNAKTEISVGFHQLLVYLVYHDFLPEGNYLIEVYW